MTDLPDPPPDASHVFRNESWEVHLLFDRDDNGAKRVSPRSTIKNVHVSRRDQDLGTQRTPGGVDSTMSAGCTPQVVPSSSVKTNWPVKISSGLG